MERWFSIAPRPPMSTPLPTSPSALQIPGCPLLGVSNPMLSEHWRLLLLALAVLDTEKFSRKTYSRSFSNEHTAPWHRNLDSSAVSQTPTSV